MEMLVITLSNPYLPQVNAKLNNDKGNNVFQPIFTSGFDPASYHLYIFNRWGEVIFESQDKEMGWDGTIDFIPVSEGMYSYKIEFKALNNDQIQSVNGHVLLIR